ncbi:hypothetical protein [Saccharothrix syringae]|uniref:hypothetical protein n=1 Tax=Saccharothrix syringae TaxID=103733 RepID=UPI001293C35A|nr:hypothetical protein [Saccharothrix syringae]
MDAKRLVPPVAAGLIAAAAVGAWSFTTRHGATPEVVEGWAVPNAAGTAISLHDGDDTREGNGYEIAGAWWAGRDNAWHSGDGPTCVGTDTAVRTRVRLGVVDVDAGGEGVGGPRVVWLRCLD